MACGGDVPTLETLAAVDLLRRHAPELKIRVINVVNLMRLQPSSEHKEYIGRHGDDMPEITGWKWGQESVSGGVRSTEADNA